MTGNPFFLGENHQGRDWPQCWHKGRRSKLEEALAGQAVPLPPETTGGASMRTSQKWFGGQGHTEWVWREGLGGLGIQFLFGPITSKQAQKKKSSMWITEIFHPPEWFTPPNSSGWPWSQPWRGSAKTKIYLLTNLDRFSTSHHGWATKHLPKCFEWDFMIELSWRERKTNFRMNIYKKAISNQQPFQVAKT